MTTIPPKENTFFEVAPLTPTRARDPVLLRSGSPVLPDRRRSQTVSGPCEKQVLDGDDALRVDDAAAPDHLVRLFQAEPPDVVDALCLVERRLAGSQLPGEVEVQQLGAVSGRHVKREEMGDLLGPVAGLFSQLPPGAGRRIFSGLQRPGGDFPQPLLDTGPELADQDDLPVLYGGDGHGARVRREVELVLPAVHLHPPSADLKHGDAPPAKLNRLETADPLRRTL